MPPPAPEPHRSVFVNCPFDEDFAPLLDAIVFSVVCCGFTPRAAHESGTVSDPRMDRILRAMFESRYSIHDLSRCKGEGDEGLARFNMPLELGIAMARRHMNKDGEGRHDWLVLVPAGHKYQKFLSDLAGFDPATHDGTVEALVRGVLGWLTTRPDAISTPNPKQVLGALPIFQKRREELGSDWSGQVPWSQLLVVAKESVPTL